MLGIDMSNGNDSYVLTFRDSNGLLHNDNGPAVEWDNGIKQWYLNGTELSEELFLKLTQGPLDQLPLYIGLGFNEYIGKRLRTNE